MCELAYGSLKNKMSVNFNRSILSEVFLSFLSHSLSYFFYLFLILSSFYYIKREKLFN